MPQAHNLLDSAHRIAPEYPQPSESTSGAPCRMCDPCRHRERDRMPIDIALATSSADEAQVRDRLLGLLGSYDLARWQFTDTIRIEAGVTSHSHPILTIRSPLSDDDTLLATYLHEQLHWFTLVPANRIAVRCAEARWRELYPEVPVDYPEGCGSERSNYLHFTVCYFTHKAMIELVGVERAQRELERQIARPWYRFINRTVRDDFACMTTTVAECGFTL